MMGWAEGCLLRLRACVLRPARLFTLWPALLHTLLTACATVQSLDTGRADAFSRTGRFALTVQTPDAPPHAVQGGFAWYDDARMLRVNLTNPMGTVLAQLRVEPDRAVFVRSSVSEEIAHDPDALVARVLGRNVPVSFLRAWLRGQVSPQATGVVRDDAGQVQAFMQDGWHVQLSRFDAQGPRLLRLRCGDGCGDSGATNQQVQLRLVIDGE